VVEFHHYCSWNHRAHITACIHDQGLTQEPTWDVTWAEWRVGARTQSRRPGLLSMSHTRVLHKLALVRSSTCQKEWDSNGCMCCTLRNTYTRQQGIQRARMFHSNNTCRKDCSNNSDQGAGGRDMGCSRQVRARSTGNLPTRGASLNTLGSPAGRDGGGPLQQQRYAASLNTLRGASVCAKRRIATRAVIGRGAEGSPPAVFGFWVCSTNAADDDRVDTKVCRRPEDDKMNV
jgi:hypothetical protein